MINYFNITAMNAKCRKDDSIMPHYYNLSLRFLCVLGGYNCFIFIASFTKFIH
jgi:hypothetical protein